MPDSLKIGTLGTGRMASNLARIWAGAGRSVFLGSRDAAQGAAAAAAIGPGVQGGPHADAVAFGDVILLAVPWTSAEATVHNLALDGKIIIDITNPVDADVGPYASGAERLAAAAPGARLVKAFNHIHFALLDDPVFSGQTASGFYCGDDDAAKAAARQLIAATGYAPVDIGPLASARMLEALAALWIAMAFRFGYGPDFALTMLPR